MAWKRVGALLLVLVGIAGLYLLFWPVPIDPLAWTPPEAPSLTGVYAPNSLLAPVERLGQGAGKSRVFDEDRLGFGGKFGEFLGGPTDCDQQFCRFYGHSLGSRFFRATGVFVDVHRKEDLIPAFLQAVRFQGSCGNVFKKMDVADALTD